MDHRCTEYTLGQEQDGPIGRWFTLISTNEGNKVSWVFVRIKENKSQYFKGRSLSSLWVLFIHF